MQDRKKRNMLFVVVVLCMYCFVATAWAAAAHKVKVTAHNLSVHNFGSAIYSDSESEICIFCHTPHNSVPGKKFLWNRSSSTANFQLYTASPTLNFSKGGLTLNNSSKMCMSCHDGGTAINAMARVNKPVTMAGGVSEIGQIYCGPPCGIGPSSGSPSDPNPNIGEGVGNGDFVTDVPPGGNLTNDHPVSFPYSESAANDSIGIKPADSGGKSVGNGVLPLWLSDSGTQYMVECPTCHDPHVNYNAVYSGDAKLRPFLRKSNESSSLCYTCHNK